VTFVPLLCALCGKKTPHSVVKNVNLKPIQTKMKNKILALCFVALSFPGIAQQKKILIVATNVSIVNGKVNGTYLMEITVPFYYFIKQGFEVDIVSPKGGKIAIYHKGDTVKILKDIAKDKLFIEKTSSSLSPGKINPKHYAAIIFPGGYGHFWDVYQNKRIASLTSEIYENGGAIGALGHGTADLLNVKLKSGDYLVKGKTMTCFPSWVEKEAMTEANFGQLLPVDMQKDLEVKGAILKVCTKENQKTCTGGRVTDTENRIVTASFADSGEFIAMEVIKLIQK